MLAAFEINTFPCGETGLAAFDVSPLPFEAGRRWRYLRLTHTLVAGRRWRHFRLSHSLVAGRCWRPLTLTLYPLRRDGVGGI